MISECPFHDVNGSMHTIVVRWVVVVMMMMYKKEYERKIGMDDCCCFSS